MGKTILVSSHILAELSTICTSVGILEGGLLTTSGDVKTILEEVRAHRRFVVALLDEKDFDRTVALLEERTEVRNVERVGGAVRLSLDATEPGIAGLVTLITVGVTGLICLAASMRSEQTSQAVFRGLVGTFFWNGTLGALLGIGLVLAQNRLGLGIGFVEARYYSSNIFATLSPFYSLTESASGIWPRALMPLSSPWPGSLIYMGVVGTSQLLYLLRHVRSPETVTAARRARIRNRPRQHRQTWLTSVLVHLLDRGGSSPLNPLLAREIRYESLSQLWIRRVLFWAPLTIFLGFAVSNGSLRLRLSTPTITAILLFVLLLPALTAASLPREFERRTLDSIRSTLLTPRQIVLAKYFAGVHSGLGVLGAVFVAVAVAIVVHIIQRPDSTVVRPLLGALAIPTLTLLFYCAVGTLASVLARRSLSALFLTYATGLFLHLGLPATLVVLRNLGFRHLPQDSMVGATNTMVAALTSAGWLRENDPLPGFLLFHSIATVTALVLAVRIFKRRYNAGKA